jgi:preprotein translocase subunit SecD
MSTAEKHTSETEVHKLQARIDELEAELKIKRARDSKKHAETDKLRTDTVDKTTSEANRLLHALSMAFVEELRSAADVVKAVSDEAFKRHEDRVDRDEEITEVRLSDLGNDVAAVLNKGIDKSLAGPGRVVDKFYEVYRENSAAR